MSNRLKGCTVIFDSPIREDDAESLLEAIRMIKGVQLVEPSVNTSNDWMAATKARSDILSSLSDWIGDQMKK